MSAKGARAIVEPGWACPDCGTGDEALRYRTTKMKRCKDCQRFYNLTVNSARARRDGTAPKLTFTKPDFVAWSRACGKRRCHYCGVSEDELPKLAIRSSIGLVVQALGIDRLDNRADYTLANIAFCCYACNKVKGNVFTEQEMKAIGVAIAALWRKRLGSP